MGYLRVFLVFTAAISLGNGVQIPCNPVKKEAGFVCVCNSTYCDTVEGPGKIEDGQFHVYSTANSKPGFSHYTGFFRIQAFPPQGIKLEVNDRIKKQKIRGFGGSFTDSFGSVLNKISPETQTNLLKSYFAETGSEYSLCRFVIGSSDFSLRFYTYVPTYDPSLKSFNLTQDDYLYRISHLLTAKKLTKRKLSLLGSTWSPPLWMKRHNRIEPDHLIPKFQQAWADYHIKFLDAFKKEGVEFWGLTTGNEPLTFTFFNAGIADLVMYPEELRDWIADNLGPSLDKAGYNNLSIILMDDQRQFAYWYLDTVMRTGTAKEHTAGTGLHWYFDTHTSPLMLDKMNDKYPDKEILYTESSINPAMRGFQPVGPLMGSWRRASIFVTSLIETLSHWVTGYLDWNLALDTQGGPNINHFNIDAAILINITSDEFYKQPVFYVLGHFSKFIQPGAHIIDITQHNIYNEEKVDSRQGTVQPPPPPTGGPPINFPTSYVFTKVKYIAAVNPDGSHTVIVFNPTPSAAEIAIHDPNKGYAFIILEPESLTSVVY